MTYLIREQDGEHFVIPSYRDVLTVRQKSQLKKDILSLSQSYGEYITLQKKGNYEYELTFSPDSGYLLGESFWQYFKCPQDLIYCEAIPNTEQAILVIVKSGSVYLDGSFPLEGISEELVIFLTQETNFEIYTYGDVPISETPAEGKFSFEASSVKSFKVLDNPVFPALPLLKSYRLQLVDQVLKAQGIGVFPTKQLVVGFILFGLIWMGWSYFSAPKVVEQQVSQVNPYQQYNDALTSPNPTEEMNAFVAQIKFFLGMPGWTINSFQYSSGLITAAARPDGGKIQPFLDAAKAADIEVKLNGSNVIVSKSIQLSERPLPSEIYPIQQVMTNLIDRLSSLINSSGNSLQVSSFVNKGVYSVANITLNFRDASPDYLSAVAAQFSGLPIVLQSISITISDGNLSGSIKLNALGSQ